MSIQTRTIEYKDGDTVLEAYLAVEDGGSDAKPGVMIAHTWRGRSEFEQGKAELLAELGYAGFAIDVYGKGVLGESKEENQALLQPLLDDREMLQRRLKLGLDALRKQKEVDAERIAAIGYCFGGLSVLDLARTGADIAGVASFHGLFKPPGNIAGGSIKAKVLVSCMAGTIRWRRRTSTSR